MSDDPTSATRPRSRDALAAGDAELIDRSLDGDADALEQLLRRHHDRVLAVCHRLCHDRGDAEDAAQESLIAIVRGLERFDRRSQFSTWAYRITTNCCMDELRRRRRRPDPLGGMAAPEAVAPEAGPDLVVEGRDERLRLAAVLDELPEEFRVPLVLRDVADLDYASIGEILDLPPGTVRSRIARARARVARRLDPGNLGAPGDVTDLERP